MTAEQDEYEVSKERMLRRLIEAMDECGGG
jgi:hypothetical protein